MADENYKVRVEERLKIKIGKPIALEHDENANFQHTPTYKSAFNRREKNRWLCIPIVINISIINTQLA